MSNITNAELVVKSQQASQYTTRAVVSLLTGSVWAMGCFIASILLSVDERLRCLTSSSSYCYDSGAQGAPMVIGGGVFVVGVIASIVFSVKANTANKEAVAAGAVAQEPETV
jgi:hypothetical protein